MIEPRVNFQLRLLYFKQKPYFVFKGLSGVLLCEITDAKSFLYSDSKVLS